jgi:hypothetical protein
MTLCSLKYGLFENLESCGPAGKWLVFCVGTAVIRVFTLLYIKAMKGRI